MDSAGPQHAAVTDPGQSAAVSVVTDGIDGGTPERLVAAALATWGRVDGPLIRVGGSLEGRVSDVTDEEWTTAFDSVFLGALRLSSYIAQTLASDGSLNLVLSPSVHEPQAEMAVENGLQRGPASVALHLADELGPRGVRVNGLIFGPGATQLTTEPDPDPDPAPADSDLGRAALIDTIPMHRFGAPEEFGGVATFLMSPAASYIPGSIIPINGGMLRSL